MEADPLLVLPMEGIVVYLEPAVVASMARGSEVKLSPWYQHLKNRNIQESDDPRFTLGKNDVLNHDVFYFCLRSYFFSFIHRWAGHIVAGLNR